MRSIYADIVVLVVEDSPFARRAITKILSDLGFSKIIEAGDGEAGLTQCREHNPHLVLCDIQMQPLDGMAFVERLRNGAGGEGVNIPVIFLTNHDDTETMARASKVGASGFIAKPLIPHLLKQCVDSLLGISQG